MFEYSLKKAVVNACVKWKIPFREASSVMGPSKSTIGRWVLEYKNNGGRVKKNKGYHGRTCKLLIERVLRFISRSIKANQFITIDRLRYNIYRKLGIDLSRGTIHRAFRLCNIRRKRVAVRIYNYTLKQLHEEVSEFLCRIKSMDLSKIICIDETHVWQQEPLHYGRACGSERVVKYVHRKEKKRYFIIMAVTNQKIIAYEIHEESVNSEKYLNFLKKHIFDKYNDHYLLMDNAKIHKTIIVKEAIKDSGNTVLYIPPYSPQCNAIEEVFSKMKHYVRKQVSTKHVKDINLCIERAVKTISKNDLKNYYEHAYA